MPKAGEVAAELRKVADSLDKEPGAEINRPVMDFYHWASDRGAKDAYLNEVRLLPRPLKKEYDDYDTLKVAYETEAIRVYTRIPRRSICEIIEPAKPAVYRCPPLLAEDEEESLGRP